MTDVSHAALANGAVPKASSESAELPTPKGHRWQPLRSGLINLFHYADQQFWYEDGRLLLRGNNGTGKSRVLALQLPFLLDAELSPTRMEPDRSPSKRPEWNLLLGGKHRERLGYTWIEFGRIAPAGHPEYFTLGCGLQAVQHRGSADAWFFTTTDRVGESLELVQDSVPLSKARLSESLGETGTLYRTQGEYKRAVDEKMFRLGGRYRALIDLLIQLRVPQLSRDFDEKRVSTQLSDALPPLAIDVLSQVADAMQDLDEQRERLEELRRSGAGARSFRDHYRSYLRIALKRRVGDLIAIHNRYDRALRTINEHRRALEESAEQHAQVTESQDAAETDRQRSAATLETLRARPEMDDARRLDDLRADCIRLDGQCDRAEAATRRAEAKSAEAMDVYRDEEHQAERDQTRTRTQIDELRACQLPPSVLDPFRSVAPALLAEPTATNPLSATQRAIETGLAASRTLRTGQRELERLGSELQQQIHRRSDLEARLETDRQRLAERIAALAEARSELRSQLVRWFDEASPLAPFLPGRAEWLEMMDGADADSGDGDSGDGDGADISPLEVVAVTIATAIDAASVKLEQRQVRLDSAQETSLAQISDLETRLQTLIDGAPIPPTAPVHREASVRQRRRGGPLYELCEFVDSVPEGERAAWEAALESSGLLDAWLTPNGLLESPELHDITLLADGRIADENARLSCILRPAGVLRDGMSPEVVQRLLESIGCGKDTASAWVDHDGTWQLGPARGAWSKDQVEHIGAAAREQRRQRQIGELRSEIAEARGDLERINSEIETARHERESLSAHRRSVPTDDRFRGALAARRESDVQCLRNQQALTQQLQVVGMARTAMDAATERFRRDAADLGMEDWADRLDELDAALGRFGHGVELLRRDLEALRKQLAIVARSKHVRESADELLQKERQAEKDFKDQRTQKRAQLKTLESSVGKDVQMILAEIEQQQATLATLDGRLKSLREDLLECVERRGKLQGELDSSELVLQQYDSDRKSRIASVESFADLGLASQALEDDASSDEHAPVQLPETPWSATRAAEIARQIRDGLRGVPDSDAAWNSAQNDLQEQFRSLEQSLLPTGVTPQFQSRDETAVITVPYQGVVCSPSELSRRLLDEVLHRETLITRRERELFEQRLIGDIAGALHRNIREAHELCTRMNHEVQSRPMSTGMRLRFRWQPDPEGRDEMKVACDSLLKKPSAMSDEDRAALGRFLQQRIAEARAVDEVGTWQQHLADALDYRNWFTFEIWRETDGRWQRLTRRTHGTGSGGERAVALIIPMLAALAAYYQSADDAAPRMILMDEAFVGIDNEMRAKFMDLMVQFDLGFIMTSEREWGCYPTMPALAIYHLSTRRGVDAILATRWVWNGNGRVQSDVHEPPRQQEMFEDGR